MREARIFSYYAFGYDYSFLKTKLSDGLKIKGDKSSLTSRLDTFFSFLTHLDLEVTNVVAEDLKEIREQIESFDEDARVDKDLSNKIKSAVEKLDATLDAELQLRTAYVVTPKRFPLEYLLKTSGQLFAKDVFEHLPDICQFDFSEACRCVAFNLPTAAAFHLMRATEGVLRYYYFNRVKRNRIKQLMWGNVVTELRRQKHPPSKPLMDNLDNIRVSFRNPTQHPDARYDSDEAQDLMALCIEVINRMMKEILLQKPS